MSRHYEQDDRFRDREYGRRGLSGRRFIGSPDRERVGERPSRRFEADDEEPRFAGNRYREREFDRQYGTGYEPGYGLNYKPRQASRYQPSRQEARPFDREYQGRYRQRTDYRRFDPNFDRARDFGHDRSYDEERQEERGWWERVSDEVASWFGDEAAERRRHMDELSAGSYRGKGPRSYKRSDDRIREDVNDRLTDYSHLDASDIEVTVLEGAVTLDGWVENRWAKRSAEDIVDSVSGVKDVQNNLRIGRPASETVDTGSELLGTSGSSKARAKGAS